jgi:hypothetical protein
MKRGDTLDLSVGPVLDENQQRQNLAGSTVRFTAKDRIADADVAAVITGTGTIPTQTGDDLGRARVVIPPAATSGFTAKRVLHWDVQLSNPAETKTLDGGLLYVDLDVTRTS